MNKKIIFLLFSVISLSAILLSSCKKEEASGEAKMVGFYITPRSTVAEVGEPQQITVWASYTDGSKVNMTDSVKITSSDPATVSVVKGVATGLKDGRVTLTATYKDRMDTCSFAASSIKNISLSIADESESLLVFPEDKIESLAVVLTAVYTNGMTKNVEWEDIYSNNISAVEIAETEEGVFDGLKVAKVEKDSAIITATYSPMQKSKGKMSASVTVYVGEIVGGVIYLDSTVMKDNKPVYGIDTVKLGETHSVLVSATFSWKCFGFKDNDESVGITDSVKDDIISLDENTLPIVDGPAVFANLKDTASISVKYIGKSFSRKIEVVTDSTYAKSKYEVGIFTDYAYTSDVIAYTFTQKFENGVVINLTNTGNKNITSFLVYRMERIGEEVVSSGVLSVPADCKETGGNDSLRVCVIYGEGPTTISKGIVLYDNPSLAFNEDGNIKINGSANSLHFDECTIVDNTGKNWTDKIDKKTLVLEVDKEMQGRTLVMTYGPEKRTAVLAVPVIPEP